MLILSIVLCESIVQAWVKGHRIMNRFMNSFMDNFMDNPMATGNLMYKS